jgi:hypothetical protein
MQPLSIYLILMMICQFSGCAKTTSTVTTSTATSLATQWRQSQMLEPYLPKRLRLN